MDNNGYRLLLPEGTLDYFIISDVKESASEIVIYLEEKNEVPKRQRHDASLIQPTQHHLSDSFAILVGDSR